MLQRCCNLLHIWRFFETNNCQSCLSASPVNDSLRCTRSHCTDDFVCHFNFLTVVLAHISTKVGNSCIVLLGVYSRTCRRIFTEIGSWKVGTFLLRHGVDEMRNNIETSMKHDSLTWEHAQVHGNGERKANGIMCVQCLCVCWLLAYIRAVNNAEMCKQLIILTYCWRNTHCTINDTV